MSDNSSYQSPIPRAVREQAERAEQLAREHGVANVPEGSDDNNPASSSGDGAPVSPPSPPQEDAGGTSQPPASAEAPGGAEREYERDYAQRYRTLQGKYDAEVPALRSQIQNLHNLLASLQSAPPPPASPPPSFSPPTPTITAEDREMWGEDLPNAVNRWVGASQEQRFRLLEGEISRLNHENQQLRGGQERVDTTLTQHSVQAQLDMDPDLAGRWRQLNEDARYHEWLGEPDPFSGRQRLGLLREAYDQGDALRTGYFFKTYLAEHTAPPASRQTPHTGLNGATHQPTGMRLEQLAAPGRAAASGTNGGASQERKIWTNREIGAFYRDVNRGVFRGREPDKLRIEQDILSAASEGRVTQ